MPTKLFSELGLSEESLKAVDKLGFEQASPIQAEAIPVLLAGRDVVGQSQTGSGKTAAFGLPTIEKVDPQQKHVQALILCPTRELAVQVSEDLHHLSAFKRGLHPLPIYGGQSYERQFQGLRQGAQIVIGTPGRVMDHMRRGTLRLNHVKIVVLDEADVMLDMGFREDIELILQSVPQERQTVFFSATMPRPIQELIQRYSRDPQTVRIQEKELTVPTVEQFYYEVDRRFKVELLTRLIDVHDLRLGIIFCNTKRMVDDLVEHLNAQGYSADRLHGDMSQALRDRVMNRFRKSDLEFLVATDVAARGIDVDDVQVVFNYDLPYDAEDYLHRIGRTGRAGRSGMAISFASGREIFQIQQIERFTRVKMRRGKPPTAREVEEAREGVVLGSVRATLAKGDYRAQEPLIGRLLEEGFSSTDIAAALLHQLRSGEASQAPKTPALAKPATSGERSPTESISKPQSPRRDRPALPGSAQLLTEPKKPVAPPAAPKPPAPLQPAVAAEPREPHKASSSPQPQTPKPRPEPKPERKPAEHQTRLHMNVGQQMGIRAEEIINAILGETGLPKSVVGRIEIRDRHLFVDVASEHVHAILSKLNRTRIHGNRVRVKIA
jgi:ATP-dependent RNA helicase DeaD